MNLYAGGGNGQIMRSSKNRFDLHFYATIPPLGASTYFIVVPANCDKDAATKGSASEQKYDGDGNGNGNGNGNGDGDGDDGGDNNNNTNGFNTFGVAFGASIARSSTDTWSADELTMHSRYRVASTAPSSSSPSSLSSSSSSSSSSSLSSSSSSSSSLLSSSSTSNLRRLSVQFDKTGMMRQMTVRGDEKDDDGSKDDDKVKNGDDVSADVSQSIGSYGTRRSGAYLFRPVRNAM
jgi:hypothetical protein